MRGRFQKTLVFIKSHKLVTAIIILVVLVAVLTTPQRIKSYVQGPEARYETAKVKRESIRQTVTASGEIESENQVVLKFQTSGKLAWIGVKEGDHVDQWQAVASLDKRELEKDLKTELNDYMSERWDFEADREDYHVTTDDLDRYTLENDIRRILDKAQFDLNNKVIDVEVADLAVKLATLVSPISGIVTDIEEPIAGVNITPATAEITIADPKQMKFVAALDETDVGGVKAGQEVTVFLDAYPDEEFKGVVNQVAFASVATSGGGTAFPVEVFLPESSAEKFKLGMNGDVEIILSAKENVLTVPLEALKAKNGQSYVEIIEGKKVIQAEVETGLEGETQSEILSGLEEGQKVIIGDKEK